jgi:hypothetical protein
MEVIAYWAISALHRTAPARSVAAEVQQRNARHHGSTDHQANGLVKNCPGQHGWDSTRGPRDFFGQKIFRGYRNILEKAAGLPSYAPEATPRPLELAPPTARDSSRRANSTPEIQPELD